MASIHDYVQVKTSTLALGTTSVNELVPIVDFFSEYIMPELEARTSKGSSRASRAPPS